MTEKQIEAHWKELDDFIFPPGSKNVAAKSWCHKLIPDFKVLKSFSLMEDGSRWIHISLSRKDRLPSWAEITKVKNEFLGEETEAYHIIPKASQHVNLHSYCMHLWSPIETNQVLPNLQNLIHEAAYLG